MGAIKWFANIVFVRTRDKLTGNESFYEKYFRNNQNRTTF